jgi:SAM-dependent methyltransferase
MSSTFPTAAKRPFHVRPVQAGPTPCKVCGQDADLFGVHDFNRSCEEGRGAYLPLVGVPIYYRRCGACGLLFTDAFDDWTDEDFAAHIYNEDYGQVDIDFVETRPVGNAGLVARTFAGQKQDLKVLDYGGGNGRFAQELRAAGFPDVTTYDGFHPEHRVRPAGKFNLVTCFETVEHMPDPHAAATDIASFLADDGLLILGTVVQPADIEQQRMSWWYIGPRNGHITLSSRKSLKQVWARLGLNVTPTPGPALHLICREVPAFAKHVIKDTDFQAVV